LDADNEPFIFRKFDKLGALNLLYLQSEMLGIEAELQRLDEEDMKYPDITSIEASRQWEVLVAQCAAPDSLSSQAPGTEPNAGRMAKRRMDLILRLRTRIKEYRKAAPFSVKAAEAHM
jgi:hypothetical protein